MEGGSVELLIVVLGDDEGALRPDGNHYEEAQGDDSDSDRMTGDFAGDCDGIRQPGQQLGGEGPEGAIGNAQHG